MCLFITEIIVTLNCIERFKIVSCDNTNIYCVLYICIYMYLYYLSIYSIKNCFIGMTVNDTILPKLSRNIK